MKRQHILHSNRYVHTYSLAEAVAKALYLSAVSLLCFYASVWMSFDIFPDWELTAQAQKWLCIVVLITSAVYEIGIQALPRYRGTARMLAAAVCGMIFYFYAKERRIDLEDGTCAFATQFLEKFNRHLKTSFYIWKGREEYLGMSFAFCCICTALALLLLVLITGRRILLLAMPAAVLSALLLVGYVPQWRGLALFFTAVMVVSAAEEDRRKKTVHAHIDVRSSRAHQWYLKWIPVVCLAGGCALLLLLGSVVFEMPARELMDQAPRVQAFQKNTERSLESAVRGYLTPFRETIHNKAPKYTGKEVLKVTASVKPAADVYLKGFYGTDYQNGAWVCNKSRFEEACMQAGLEPEEAAAQLYQAPYEAFLNGESRASWQWQIPDSFEKSPDSYITYTIEQKGMLSKYAYLPYIIDFEKDRSKERLTGDVTVQKGWGQKKFTFEGFNYPIHEAADIQMKNVDKKPVFQWYDAFALSSYMGLSDQVTDISTYLNSWETYHARQYVQDENGDIVYHPQVGTTGRAIELMLQSYQEYLETVEGHDLQINQVRMSAAEVISMILKRQQTYSLNLSAVPAGMDAVDFFLMSSHEGYCVHFASAAVLMMREVGVPARYVSGYVARQDEFEYNSDTGVFEAHVKDSGAHAWAEIYLNQIGWLPVDVTPGQSAAQNENGSQGQGDETDQERSDSNETDADETNADETDLDETNADDTDLDETDLDETNADDNESDSNADDLPGQGTSNGRKGTGWKKWLMTAAAAGAILFGIIAACLAIRGAVRRYQDVLTKELEHGRYRSAVLKINRRIYRKQLLHGRIRSWNLTDAQYEQLLAAAYAGFKAADWKRYMCIVKEAAFSGKELRQEDAYFCYKMYRKL